MRKPLGIGLLSLVLGCGVAGCTGDPFSVESGRESITFSVLGSSFETGETITATLVNRSDREVGYNLCLAELDLQAAAGWQRIPRHPPGAFCPLIQWSLGPGGSVPLTQPVREEFPAGVYRFRVEVTWPIVEGQRLTVTTGSFVVEG